MVNTVQKVSKMGEKLLTDKPTRTSFMNKRLKGNIVLIIHRLENLQRNSFLENQYMMKPDIELLEMLVKLSKENKII
jgi:hypothetical protein